MRGIVTNRPLRPLAPPEVTALPDSLGAEPLLLGAVTKLPVRPELELESLPDSLRGVRLEPPDGRDRFSGTTAGEPLLDFSLVFPRKRCHRLSLVPLVPWLSDFGMVMALGVRVSRLVCRSLPTRAPDCKPWPAPFPIVWLSVLERVRAAGD